jgi:hypothetical protein
MLFICMPAGHVGQWRFTSIDSCSWHEVGVGRSHPSANLSLEKLPSIPNEKEGWVDSRGGLEFSSREISVVRRMEPDFAVIQLVCILCYLSSCKTHTHSKMLFFCCCKFIPLSYSFISIQHLGRFSRNQNPVRRPVWLRHTASWASS